MKDKNLTLLLSSLSRKEMTRLRQFLYSPYFNKHQGTKALFDILEKEFPAFEPEAMAPEVLISKLQLSLGPDKINKATLSLLQTYLQKLVLHFIALEKRLEMEDMHDLAVLEGLRQREQYKLYEKLEKKIIGKAKADFAKDSPYYYAQFRHMAEFDAYRNQRGKYDQPAFLLEKQEMLNAFFLTEKIKDACELAQRAIVLKQDSFEKLDDFAIQEIHRNIDKYKNVPPLVCYQAVYEMLDSNDDVNFQKAEDQLKVHLSNLAKADLTNIYNFLLNFCIQRVNEGESVWLKKSFELYKGMLENQLLEVDGILPEWHYKNLATNGLLLNETTWVYEFIHQYKSSLTPDISENAFSYNLAALYHQLGQYEDVLPLLLRVEYTDWRYALNAKVLLLKTYYEMDESEALLALHDSFRQFIQRHRQLNDFRRRSYYNLLRFTIKSFKLKMEKEYFTKEKAKAEFSKIKDQFANCKQCFNRSWVSQKIQALNIN